MTIASSNRLFHVGNRWTEEKSLQNTHSFSMTKCHAKLHILQWLWLFVCYQTLEDAGNFESYPLNLNEEYYQRVQYLIVAMFSAVIFRYISFRFVPFVFCSFWDETALFLSSASFAFSFSFFVNIYCFMALFAGRLGGVNFFVAIFRRRSFFLRTPFFHTIFAYICVNVARSSYHLHTHFHTAKNSFAPLWHRLSSDGYFFYLQYSTCHFLYLFSVDSVHGAHSMHWASATFTCCEHELKKKKKKKRST